MKRSLRVGALETTIHGTVMDATAEDVRILAEQVDYIGKISADPMESTRIINYVEQNRTEMVERFFSIDSKLDAIYSLIREKVAQQPKVKCCILCDDTTHLAKWSTVHATSIERAVRISELG